MDPFTSRKSPTGPSNGTYRLNQPMSRQTATAPRPTNEVRASALRAPAASFEPSKPSSKQVKSLKSFDCLDEIVAIRFPVPTLSGPLREAARWLNFFDADDVLGYPLRPLSPSYHDAVTADLQINVGSPLRSWNPLSHEEYWTDNDFTAPVATLIRELLDASRAG